MWYAGGEFAGIGHAVSEDDGRTWTELTAPASPPWNGTSPADMRYDFDALVFSGGRAGLPPSIMTFGGDRERFGLPDEANAFLLENDVCVGDVLRFPDGQGMRLKVRSMVGLLPIAAVTVFEEDILELLPTFRAFARDFLRRHPELAANVHMPATPGVAGRRLLSIVNEGKLRRILARMLDESEFFSPHGLRALSRQHREQPFVFHH